TAQLKLAKLPRNSSPTRLHNRCEVTGRPRAYYRRLRMSRIALRDLASIGQIPGMVKSSWSGVTDVSERTARRHADPHPECLDARQVDRTYSGLEDPSLGPRCPEIRRLHPRLRGCEERAWSR